MRVTPSVVVSAASCDPVLIQVCNWRLKMVISSVVVGTFSSRKGLCVVMQFQLTGFIT